MIMIPNSTTAIEAPKKTLEMYDISECANANEVLEVMNVGRYTETRIPHICDGYKVIKNHNGAPLSIVKNTYEMVQPIEALAYFDTLREHMGFTYDKAGFLKGGRRMYINARLDNLEVPHKDVRKVGDVLEKRISFMTSWDYSCTSKTLLELLRQWCSNGCASWVQDSIFNVKHTKNAGNRIKTALRQATGLKQVIQDLDNDIALLANTEANEEQFDKVARLVFPSDTTASRNIRDSLSSQFTNERLGAFGNTAWDVLNAFTAYQTHERTIRETKGSTREENAFNAQRDSSFARQVRTAIEEVFAV